MKKIGILNSSLFLILFTYGAGGAFAASNLNTIPEVKNTSTPNAKSTTGLMKVKSARFVGKRLYLTGVNGKAFTLPDGTYRNQNGVTFVIEMNGMIENKVAKVVGQRIYLTGAGGKSVALPDGTYRSKNGVSFIVEMNGIKAVRGRISFR